jgi:hypothetical protein
MGLAPLRRPWIPHTDKGLFSANITEGEEFARFRTHAFLQHPPPYLNYLPLAGQWILWASISQQFLQYQMNQYFFNQKDFATGPVELLFSSYQLLLHKHNVMYTVTFIHCSAICVTFNTTAAVIRQVNNLCVSLHGPCALIHLKLTIITTTQSPLFRVTRLPPPHTVLISYET